MSRRLARTSRGFFCIGIYGNKTPANLGTLWRHALSYGAASVFTVGKRYQRQCTDTPYTSKHIPLTHYTDIDDLIEHLPHATPLVGIELTPEALVLGGYSHRARACYLLGAEDTGLPAKVLERCTDVVQIEALQDFSLNVSVAGSLVMYDRHRKSAQRLRAVS